MARTFGLLKSCVWADVAAATASRTVHNTCRPRPRIVNLRRFDPALLDHKPRERCALSIAVRLTRHRPPVKQGAIDETKWLNESTRVLACPPGIACPRGPRVPESAGGGRAPPPRWQKQKNPQNKP